MIFVSLNLIFLFHLINGQHRNYNFFMPDLPRLDAPLLSSSSSVSIIRETHSFTKRSFTKINLIGGPFNVKLYRNIKLNTNYTSVDVEAEKSLHPLISVDIEQNDLLTIRMTNNLKLNNRTNTTVFIIYQQLNELYIDGMINIKCINQIQTDKFRLHNRGNGLVKLKLNVNVLDAYLHSIGRIKLCGRVNYEATIQSLGVGDVECQNLLTKKINVLSRGIGNIYVMAIDEINITLSGIGTVYYSGPLKHRIKTGLGDIVEIQSID